MPRWIAVAGMLCIAASGIIVATTAALSDLSEPSSAAERWVSVGSGVFTASVSLLLAWGVARFFGLAQWLAAAQAVLMIGGVAAGEFHLMPIVGAAAGVGGLGVLTGLASLAARSILGSRRDQAARTWLRLETAVRIILLVHVVAMLGWVANYAMFVMLGGLIGFEDVWTVPVGVAVVAALVRAGVIYRAGSFWGRALTGGGLAGSAAALLYPLQTSQSTVTQVTIAALVALAVFGIVVVAAERQPAPPRGAPVR